MAPPSAPTVLQDNALKFGKKIVFKLSSNQLQIRCEWAELNIYRDIK